MALPIKEKLSSQFLQYQRVWNILRKPSMDEMKMISKVSALGLVAIGAIGFVIAEIMALMF